MNKLRTRFGMALGIVLFVATILPNADLVFVEHIRAYRGHLCFRNKNTGQEIRTLMDLPHLHPTTTTYPSPQSWVGLSETEQGFRLLRVDPETRQRIPAVIFDPERAYGISWIPSALQRVVLTSLLSN